MPIGERATKVEQHNHLARAQCQRAYNRHAATGPDQGRQGMDLMRAQRLQQDRFANEQGRLASGVRHDQHAFMRALGRIMHAEQLRKRQRLDTGGAGALGPNLACFQREALAGQDKTDHVKPGLLWLRVHEKARW